MAEQFTNRELFMLIEKNNETNQLQHASLLQSIKEFHDKTEGTLGTILAQTTKTNGRVTKNEDNINKLNSWKSYLAGGMALFCLIGLPTIWILIQNVKADSVLMRAHIAQDK